MKELRPIHITESYYELIEREILKYLRLYIYKPLHDLIKEETGVKVLTNARKGQLIDAILSGKVQYIDGKFEGSFDAGISKELKGMGATFNRGSGTFSLAQAKLNLYSDVSSAVGQAYSSAQDLTKKITKYIQSINADEIADKLNLTTKYGQAIEAYNKEIVKSFGKYSKNVINLKLHPDMVKKLSKQYSEQMKPYIKTWVKDDILKLRGKVQENVFAGYRASTLVKDIQKRYEVNKSKAKFLARQETSILLSTVRENRYKDAGVKRYKWSTSMDERVRPFHQQLHGKIFDWDNPPITDDKGHRNNPGMDFNCRCVARPIID